MLLQCRTELDVFRSEVHGVLVHAARRAVGRVARRDGRGESRSDASPAGCPRRSGSAEPLVDGEKLLEAVNHALGPAQAEGRDDDLTLKSRGRGATIACNCFISRS